MNYYRFIFWILLVIGTGTLGLFAQTADPPKPNQISGIPEEEAVFSADELKEYYAVYDDPIVKYLRVVFDKYLKDPDTKVDELVRLKGSDEYIKAKFIVLSRDPDLLGNVHITLLFPDKPDKVFIATVYAGNGLRLAALAPDPTFTDEDVRRLNIRYRKFIQDKKHSM